MSDDPFDAAVEKIMATIADLPDERKESIRAVVEEALSDWGSFTSSVSYESSYER